MAQLSEFDSGQSIEIRLLSDEKLCGSFYCHDPESKSIIIQNEQGQLIWMNGHNIKCIKPLETKSTNIKLKQSALITKIEIGTKQLIQKDNDNQPNIKISDKMQQLQQRLMKFLSERQLSPELDKKSKAIKIGSSLCITAPYNKDCCRSTNEIVLGTVLKLLNEFYNEKDNKEYKQATDSDDLLEID